MNETSPAWRPLDLSVETHFDGRRVRCITPRSTTVLEALDAFADSERDALVDGSVRLSHAALRALTTACAERLAALDVRPGERVALLLGNRLGFVVYLLGAMRLGAIPVPLNVRMAAPEIVSVLGDCAASAVVFDSELDARVPAAGTTLRVRVRLAEGADLDGLSDAASRVARPTTGEEDVALLLYTSGTTGAPKGAMLTHFNVIHSCLHYHHCFELDADTRAVVAVPASHVTGVVALTLTTLLAGGCVIMQPRFEPAAFLRIAAAERMSFTIAVPAMYRLCLLERDFYRHDLTAWRVGAYGGAPMPEATIAELAERLPRLRLSNAYGATETTSPATLMPPAFTARHSDSVGVAVPCADLLIADEHGEPVPTGETGEVWIKGPMVVPGYWNDPPAGRSSFRDGYWCSGDVGSLDEHGFLRVLDRIKDVINRGGYTVYSVEVENALMHHEAVVEAGVVAVPDDVLGERIQAFVRLREGAQLTSTELREFARSRLSSYKLPDAVEFLETPLPRNAAGKILKRALRERSTPRPLRVEHAVSSPRSHRAR